jgi:ABC-type transporter Mla MlaB component
MKIPKRKTKSVSKVSEPKVKLIGAEPVVGCAPAVCIALPAHCTVKDAAAFKLDLCAMAEQNADVSIELTAVERIDTATIQLLCAFVRDRAARNQKVIFKGESNSWREAVRLLGVAELLCSKGVDQGVQV